MYWIGAVALTTLNFAACIARAPEWFFLGHHFGTDALFPFFEFETSFAVGGNTSFELSTTDETTG